MEPINLPIAELKPALIGLGKVINKHSTLPVLAGVKIEKTSEGWITLTATDLEHFITVRLEQPAEGEPMCIVIPYSDMQKVSSQCGTNDTISIRSLENRSVWSVILQYSDGNQLAEHQCQSLPVQEFPPTPRVKGEPVPVNDSLREIIHEAFDCACNDPSRQILNGVFIDVSNPKCNQIVATDGHHLFASNSFSLPMEESIIIPEHKFLGWRGFNSDGEWQLRAGEVKDKRLVQIASRRWRFITPQHEGQYPNYRQVIPSEFKTTVQLADDVLASAATTLESIPCDPKNKDHPVCFKVDGGQFIIRGRINDDAPWRDVAITGAKVSGDPVTICLNRDFALKAFKFGLNRIEIIDAMSPIRFSRGGKQLVVMPIRIKSTPPSSASSAAMESKPQPTTERRNMVTNNTTPATVEAKPALETALEQMETLKESLKANLASVNIITGLLKQPSVNKRSYNANIAHCGALYAAFKAFVFKYLATEIRDRIYPKRGESGRNLCCQLSTIILCLMLRRK